MISVNVEALRPMRAADCIYKFTITATSGLEVEYDRTTSLDQHRTYENLFVHQHATLMTRSKQLHIADTISNYCIIRVAYMLVNPCCSFTPYCRTIECNTQS